MPDRPHTVIAIDGPAASGKSSVARELARRLGFVYVNSGAMYRAVTWHVLQNQIDPSDIAAVEQHVASLQIDCDVSEHRSRIVIDRIDPAAHLNDEAVNRNVSSVSRAPKVRRILVQKMREYACHNDLVMEGRDIGSVVFPETPYKFYIDASPEIRSQRRAAQGQNDEIALRDRADSSRPTSPLVKAPDAEVIDSSDLTIDQVVDRITTALRQRGLKDLANR